MRNEVFRMERVTYESRGLKQLDYLNLSVLEGEILGFLPINSSGLSAFIQVLKANHPLEDGYIYYNERLINSWKDSDKQPNRITVIGDNSCLIEDLTVYDNIFVLRQSFRRELISPRLLERQLAPFLTEVGIALDASSHVDKLTSFERVVVETLKGIVAGHKLIVLEEIQNLITDSERKKLHSIMDFYTKKGVSFLYISVHFEDILQTCHRAVFFQNGRIVKTLQPHQLTMDNLVVSTEAYQDLIKRYVQTKDPPQGDTNFALRFAFQSVDCLFRLETKKQECVVVQCLDNQMYKELIQSILNRRLPPGSHMEIDNRKQAAHTRELAVIVENPSKTMLFPHLSCMDNLCFNMDGRIKGFWLRDDVRKSVQREYHDYLEDIFTTPMEQLTEQQKYKLIYTRILLQKPKVALCIQPFKGADLGMRMYIFTLLENLLRNGITVVILAINLADSLSIADRLILLEQGKPQTQYLRSQFKDIKSVAPWKNIKDE